LWKRRRMPLAHFDEHSRCRELSRCREQSTQFRPSAAHHPQRHQPSYRHPPYPHPPYPHAPYHRLPRPPSPRRRSVQRHRGGATERPTRTCPAPSPPPSPPASARDAPVGRRVRRGEHLHAERTTGQRSRRTKLASRSATCVSSGGASDVEPTVAVDEPTVDEPTVDEPTVDEPTVDEPTVDEPSDVGPTVDEPTVDGRSAMAVGSVAAAAAAAGREERMVGCQSEAINDTHQLRGEERMDGWQSEAIRGNQRQLTTLTSCGEKRGWTDGSGRHVPKPERRTDHPPLLIRTCGESAP
jgi:hypothetical protein